MPSASPIDWQAVRAQLLENEQRLAHALAPDPARVQQILEERAAAIRARRDATKEEEQAPVLLAKTRGEKLAFPLASLVEVRRIERITAVPQLGAEVLGLISVRGELHCVIDPLAQSGSEANADTSWGLVLRHPRLRLALGVGEVSGIASVPARLLTPTDEEAFVQIDDQPVRIFDVIAFLSRFEREFTNSISL